MSSSSRRILPPGTSRKRKENSSSDDFHFLKPKQASPAQATKLASAKSKPSPKAGSCSNQLLAGYMAYEFLTKGTLFGEKFDPARAEAVAVRRRVKAEHQEQVEARVEYAEVANIMKAEGTHIPGIVNPTQLSRWIQM